MKNIQQEIQKEKEQKAQQVLLEQSQKYGDMIKKYLPNLSRTPRVTSIQESYVRFLEQVVEALPNMCRCQNCNEMFDTETEGQGELCGYCFNNYRE